jgi:transcriptional regulator GlxA family with amidase domain
MRLRVERAKQLLSGTQLGLQRVAQLAGFSTRHHFGHMFKSRTGETPGAYRARDKQTWTPLRVR